MATDKQAHTFFRYFPVAKRDRDWGLFITTVGASQIGPGINNYPPGGHPKGYASVTSGRTLPEYQIIYISAGSGWFKSAGISEQPIGAGQVMLLFPGVRHSYAPSATTGWDEHWVGFNGDLAHRFLRRGFFAPRRPVLRAGSEEQVLALFNDLVKTSHDNHPASQQILAGITMNILARLYSVQQFSLGGDEPGLRAIQNAVVRMRESAEVPLDIPGLARELNVGYRWFRRAFTHHTGLSPNKYLLEIRLARARSLLAQSPLSIKEIALRTGFEDAQYFCRFFHKKVGVTPGRWRAQALKGNIG
jgi:AraC-like DNA-binding protein